jgi:hypothetical protein
MLCPDQEYSKPGHDTVEYQIKNQVKLKLQGIGRTSLTGVISIR